MTARDVASARSDRTATRTAATLIRAGQIDEAVAGLLAYLDRPQWDHRKVTTWHAA